MRQSELINLILCGGSGTRLWPLSRNRFPKQFYPLFNGTSLFEGTLTRNQTLASEFWVASNKNQLNLAISQMERNGIDRFSALVEPIGRNTAPPIVLVCLRMNADDIILVTPSDHLIRDLGAYQKAIAKAKELAAEGFLVTFGIQPAYPETGYGYIEANEFEVVSFKEKPNYETAQKYVEDGRHYWNSGMLLFRAQTLLDEMKLHCPDLLEQCEKVTSRYNNRMQIVEIDEDSMREIDSISIDYALLEKSKKVRVVPCNPGWSDLGSFDAIFDDFCIDKKSNVEFGTHKPEFLESEGNLVISTSRKVSLVEVRDLIVVDTPDALLVTKRGSSQKVKSLIAKIEDHLL